MGQRTGIRTAGRWDTRSADTHLAGTATAGRHPADMEIAGTHLVAAEIVDTATAGTSLKAVDRWGTGAVGTHLAGAQMVRWNWASQDTKSPTTEFALAVVSDTDSAAALELSPAHALSARRPAALATVVRMTIAQVKTALSVLTALALLTALLGLVVRAVLTLLTATALAMGQAAIQAANHSCS